MEERFPSSRGNPRFPTGDRPLRPAAAAEPPPPPARQLPSILERFRAMLREREEELREVIGEDPPPPPTAGEIVRLYEELLLDLTFNSKPIITELTIIAGQHVQFAEGIADAICSRVLEVPVDQKLPSLYLLDSIVKNIGREYVRYFAARLPKVFCEAYNQVHPSQYPSLRHLFGTWFQVFPLSALRRIEDELQFSPSKNNRSSGITSTRHSESPSPRPSHGIHVNPKYLEAQHLFKQSTVMHAVDSQDKVHMTDFDWERMEEHASEGLKGWSGASPKFHDIEQARGVPSSLLAYGQKSSMQSNKHGIDHSEVLPPQPGIARTGLPETVATCASSIVEAEGPNRHSKGKILRPSPTPISGPRKSISPPTNRFSRISSPSGVFKRASPSHSGFGRGTRQNDWFERSWPFEDDAQQVQSSMPFNLNNGYAKQRSRELIDAYGNYRGKNSSIEKFPKVQRLDANGVASELATRKWKNSEEEEYVWEDMSPTLSDRIRRNSLLPFGPTTGSLSIRGGLTRLNSSVLEHDFGRRSWPGQTQLPAVADPAYTVEDRIPLFASAHGSMNRNSMDSTANQNKLLPHYQGYRHIYEPRKLPYMFPQSSQQSLSPRSRGRAPQMPVAASGVAPSMGNKLPNLYENTPDVEMPFQRLPSSHSDPFNVETTALERHLAQSPHSSPPAPIMRPSVNKSQQLPLLPNLPDQKQFKSPDFLEANKPILNQGPESSLFLSQLKNNTADRKTLNSNKLLQIPHQQPGLAHANQQSYEQDTTMQIQSQEAHRGFIPPAAAQLSSQLVVHPINHVFGPGVALASVLPNPSSGSVVENSMPDTSSHIHASVLPPLPLGSPPVSLEMGPVSQNTGSAVSSSPASVFSGLISTLIAQGLISLAPPAQSQGSVGVEFNAELLKVRHESAINALYTDLPRQCTTCGLRFKCQEEHSSHMDWHVTKNRISKNRRQKPSRKWFVSAKEWLSGAETLGNDAVPGFLPTEAVTEKKDDKEMAVPADENQNVCALCGEPFEDFYCDDTEEWMYKGAVYLNAPDGYSEGLDRSQLGTIVHAKCRSESTEGSRQA